MRAQGAPGTAAVRPRFHGARHQTAAVSPKFPDGHGGHPVGGSVRRRVRRPVDVRRLETRHGLHTGMSSKRMHSTTGIVINANQLKLLKPGSRAEARHAYRKPCASGGCRGGPPAEGEGEGAPLAKRGPRVRRFRRSLGGAGPPRGTAASNTCCEPYDGTRNNSRTRGPRSPAIPRKAPNRNAWLPWTCFSPPHSLTRFSPRQTRFRTRAPPPLGPLATHRGAHPRALPPLGPLARRRGAHPRAWGSRVWAVDFAAGPFAARRSTTGAAPKQENF